MIYIDYQSIRCFEKRHLSLTLAGLFFFISILNINNSTTEVQINKLFFLFLNSNTF